MRNPSQLTISCVTNSEITNNVSTQDIEPLMLLQIQPTVQKEIPTLTSPMRFDNNTPTTSSATSFNYSNNLGNNFDGNFLGYRTSERNLEQRIQILEQQMALFYQLYDGVM